jgi:hypothetical protein
MFFEPLRGLWAIYLFFIITINIDMFKKKEGKDKINIPIYEDYNTDDDEDLDQTPDWMKDPLGNKKRVIYTDLEIEYPLPKKLKEI